MTKQIALLVLSLLVTFPRSESSSKAHLHGIVRDPYSGVVRGATVEVVADLETPESPERMTVTTDQLGKYAIELNPGRQYKICARKQGFEETCHCIRVDDAVGTEKNFSLGIDKRSILPNDYDVMDRRLQLLAGKDAINCGHVQINQLPHKETACGLNANKQKKPFYLRYDVPCSDCELSIGLAADPLGRIFAVHFDSMGMTNWERDPAETMPDGIFTVVAPCPPRPGLRITQIGALSCFSKSDKVHNIMQQLDDPASGHTGNKDEWTKGQKGTARN